MWNLTYNRSITVIEFVDNDPLSTTIADCLGMPESLTQSQSSEVERLGIVVKVNAHVGNLHGHRFVVKLG